jgi:predicted dithiol-disulfide oxidoreductase (DUF899 family)
MVKIREKREDNMNRKIGTREEWLAARLKLLESEKELTRRSDEAIVTASALKNRRSAQAAPTSRFA